MKPFSAVKNLFPIEFAGLGQCNGGTSSVINDLGSSLRSALFTKIDTQTGTAAEQVRCVNAILAELIDNALTDFVTGNLRYKPCINAIVCQRHCYVCFAASVGCLEASALCETQISFRIQTHHDFTKGYCLCHFQFLLISMPEQQRPISRPLRLPSHTHRLQSKPCLQDCRQYRHLLHPQPRNHRYSSH